MENDNADGYYDTLIARFRDLEAKVSAGDLASIEAQVGSLNSDLEKAMVQRMNDKLFGDGGAFEGFLDERPYLQARRDDLQAGM